MKIIKHFLTITHHRHLVMIHCFKAGIIFQGLKHDLSKYSFVEFSSGAKYYQGNRSPNEAEREKIGYSLAWMHHKGRNKHHFEYWYDYNYTENKYLPVRMPIRYLKEMFCDRVAASKIYKKKKYTNASALEYFISRDTKSKLHHDTAKILEYWLRMLAEVGEKKTFKAIRKVKTYEELRSIYEEK